MSEITFNDIQKANETIKTTDIKGKEYAEVNQRIKAFRMLFPLGTIKTELLNNENGICIFKATVTNNETILGTGTAYEKEGSSFINRTSYIENCETSAVGRALGMAGFGIDTSIRSLEEMQNAEIQQDEIIAEEKVGQKEIQILEATVKKYNKNETEVAEILAKYKYNNFTEIKKKDYAKIGNELSK